MLVVQIRNNHLTNIGLNLCRLLRWLKYNNFEKYNRTLGLGLGDRLDANECAVTGWSLDETIAYNDALTPLIVVTNKIDDCSLRKSSSKYTHTLSSFDMVLTKLLIGFRRVAERMIYAEKYFYRTRKNPYNIFYVIVVPFNLECLNDVPLMSHQIFIKSACHFPDKMNLYLNRVCFCK